jgi:H+-transporting ATPase
MAFAFQFDFPPFMGMSGALLRALKLTAMRAVLIIALLNDGTIMTLSVDRVLPSSTPDSWDLAEIFAYAIAYGVYLAVGTIVFYIIIIDTTFFSDKFGVVNLCVPMLTILPSVADQPLCSVDGNDSQVHMLIYLQVAQISQALIFITRSHSWFFVERPSTALFLAFCLAQLISSIIAAYGDWGFSQVVGISGGYIG